MKKKLLVLLTSVTSTAVIATALIVTSNKQNNVLSKANATNEYVLTLDENNRVSTLDKSVLTTSGNKVYFDSPDDINYSPESGWVTLVDGEDMLGLVMYNTEAIKGMESIVVQSTCENLELFYGSKVDDRIYYSNYYEVLNNTTLDLDFSSSYKPSYFKIRGVGPFTVESIVINYSCEETPVVPTLALKTEFTDESETAYRILGFENPSDKTIPDLIIPSEINGIPVTEIGDRAFKLHTNLKTITIPDSVTSIGVEAFAYCLNVEKINMPAYGIDIGQDAFLYCGDLENVTIPKDQLSVDLSKYQNNPVLESITVEEGNPNYFSENGMLYAKSYSGYNNTLLVCPARKSGTVTLNSDCEYIIDGAFNNSHASVIRFNNKVEKIDEEFLTTNSLTDFEMEAGNIHYSVRDGLLCDYMGSILYRYPRGRSVINVSLSNDIKEIAERAFYDIDNVKTILAPNVLSVGNEAFKNMDNLTSVALASLNSLGTSVFENDKKLTSAPLVNTVTLIPANTFKGCTALSSFTFPLSLTEIGASSFEGCALLTDIEFPMYQPAVTLTIKSSAFKGCSSIGDISFVDHDNIVLEGHVFEDSGLTSITFNQTITSIPDSLCQNCDSLTEVTFPVNVKTIGYDAFNDCDNLATATFVDYGVETILSKAFLNCNLRKVYFPESVSTIGKSAFNQGKLIEVYADIPGLDNGDPFDFVKKSGWDEAMCGAYYRLICGDRAYYEKQ